MPQPFKHQLPPLNISSESIGERIANIRRKHGLTQTELAQKIGISQRLVSEYETNRVRMFDDMVTRFAVALQISADELLGLKDGETLNESISLRVARRMRQIEKLPELKKKAILRTLDDLIRANS